MLKLEPPPHYYMILSQDDFSENYNEKWYFYNYLETSGLVSFTVDYTQQIWKSYPTGKEEIIETYQVSRYQRLPWSETDDDAVNEEVEINISPSDRGVLKLEKKVPNVGVLIGSITGLFVFVTIGFNMFFPRDIQQPYHPYVLFRRR